MKRIVIGVALLGVLAVATSAPASVTVSSDPGTTNHVSALTGYATTGDMMGGMTLTAYFSVGGPETVYWVDLPSPAVDAGKAVGTGWSLSHIGNTFDDHWALTVDDSISLTRLLIDAGTGDTVFDRTLDGVGNIYGTPGSATGKDFSVTYCSSTNPLNIAATYRDQVAITGFDPLEDLYRYLDIVFTTNLHDQTIHFMADTDNSVDPYVEPVPEPSALAVWSLLGLCGIGWRFRRKA